MLSTEDKKDLLEIARITLDSYIRKGSIQTVDKEDIYSTALKTHTGAFVYTDRSVYRPQQTIHWKVVAYRGGGGQPGKPSERTLYRDALRVFAGMERIFVLTQFNSVSLHRHINSTYKFAPFSRGFVEVLAAQQTIANANWYQGTADAVYQNIYTIERERPKHVVILAGDHIYKMDYARLLTYHVEREADMTVACVDVPLAEAKAFGVMNVDTEHNP